MTWPTSDAPFRVPGPLALALGARPVLRAVVRRGLSSGDASSESSDRLPRSRSAGVSASESQGTATPSSRLTLCLGRGAVGAELWAPRCAGPARLPRSVAEPAWLRGAPVERGPLLRSASTSFSGTCHVPPCARAIRVVTSARGTGLDPFVSPRALRSEVSDGQTLPVGSSSFVLKRAAAVCRARVASPRCGPRLRSAPTALRGAHPPRAVHSLLELHSEPGVNPASQTWAWGVRDPRPGQRPPAGEPRSWTGSGHSLPNACESLCHSIVLLE